MKKGVVSLIKKINSHEVNEQIIHLTLRPSHIDILSIITKCPSVKALHLPYYMQAISRSIKMKIGFLHTWYIRKHAHRSGFV